MLTYRHWMELVSAGALLSACQLGLDGRACGVAEQGRESACLEGWTCCPGNVCQRECSDPTASGDGSGDTSSPANPGDESPSDAPSVEALPEPTAEGTSLEPEPIDLPMALPRAREQASSVYSLGSRDTPFDELVRIELPTTASEISHLMLLELADDWQPVPGARFFSDGRQGGGSVAFSTDHGGIFVVVIVKPLVSIEMTLGATPYSYSCDVGQGAISDPNPNGGQGPVLDTASGRAENAPCPWPADAPRLWLAPLFRGLVGNTGPRLGTFDLAAPDSIFPLRTEFIASFGEPVAVEDEVPYQIYDSTTPIDPVSPPPSNLAFDGFRESPLATGSVSVSRLTTVANAGYSLDTTEGDPFARLYSIEFTDVTLGATAEGVPNDPPFPPTVTISKATLTYAY